MTEGFKAHLPIIAVVSLVGIATGAFSLMQVANASSSLNVDSYSLYIILIPSVLMVICPLITTMTAQEIGRQLYLVVVGICFVVGIASMVITSLWVSDPVLSANLLANSPEGTQITPPVESPLVVIRDLAAFIVAPTVGCIAGAWIGSRIHPVRRAGRGNV